MPRKQITSDVASAVMTVGTMSGQDVTFMTAGDPERLARDLLASSKPLVVTTTDGLIFWIRPEQIETISYSALEG